MIRVLLAVLLLFYAASVRAEFEFWAVIYQPGTDTQTSDLELAQQISEATGRTLSLNALSLAQLPAALNNIDDKEVIVPLSPAYYYQAIEMGMVPLMRFKSDLFIGLFRFRERLGQPILTVATPPRSSTAALVAEYLSGTSISTIETQSHSGCIRRVVTGEADACATGRFFVQQYAERFNIELVPDREPEVVPPVVLFVSPTLSDREREVIAQTPLNDGFFEYTPYVPMRDDPLFERFRDTFDRTQQ